MGAAAEDEDDGESDGESEGESEGTEFDRINYEDYLVALGQLDSRKVAPLKSARAFLSFRLDEYGRASIRSLYALACSLTQLLQTRVHLAMLEDTKGRLSEPALETFVQESIPRLARLREHVHLQPGHSFLPFYVAHCVRKLHMLLEAKDKRGVPTETLLLSAELAQLFALGAEPELDDDGNPIDDSNDDANWFSLSAAIRIYRQFLDLDSDQDGMLTAEELSRYGETLMTLTPAFVGLFEVVNTFDGGSTTRATWTLSSRASTAPTLRASPTSFACSTCRGREARGSEVNYFVRDIVQGLLDSGDEPPEQTTIVDEMFDLSKMRKPRARTGNGAGSLERERLKRLAADDLAGGARGKRRGLHHHAMPDRRSGLLELGQPRAAH